jgi:PAS domain S-box-containing protein
VTSVEPPHFLSGGGICGALARSFDWTKTRLGPPGSWPSSLKTTVGILLNSRHPMFLWWGPDLVQIYNDAYLPSFGVGKHPAAMGQRGRDCWQEIWPIIAPQIDDVMQHGRPSWNEDHLVPIFRNGRIEEVYWTYGYSPVYDDEGRVAGTLVVCTETTGRVIAERRLGVIRSLAVSLLAARDADDVTGRVAAVLAGANRDVPFALISAGSAAPLAVGLEAASAPEVEALLRGRAHRAERHALGTPLAVGPWPEPVTDVLVLPFQASPWRAIVVGLSPRLPFDDGYRGFLQQIVENVVGACARVQTDAERRGLLEQAPVATALMTGPDHVFEIANPRYRAMVGREVLGKTYLEAFPELRHTALPRILDRVYQRGEPFVTDEMLVPLERGESGKLEACFFKFNLEPIRDAQGTVFGMMAVASDITEQVTARRALEAAARAKDEFLATMSHELRTPLNAILGWAKILKEGERDPAKLDKGLAVIERNAVTQARLVSDLLDVSRIISGKLNLAMRPVDVPAAIHAAVEVVRPAADAKRLALAVLVDADVGAMVADPDRFQQVLWNLLSNAIRFTPANGHVTISAARVEAAVRVVVVDTGAGISAEHLPHVFERFRQADASTTRGYGGLGLGLAIVRHLVEAHGGTVTAHSDGPGRGASFAVSLPIRAVQPVDTTSHAERASRRDATREKAMLQNIRALVVDDDEDSLELLREVLEDAGVSFIGAKSAHQALEARGPFDIIISDIGMPQMDGYALIQRVRSRESGSSVPAIALTAYARAEDAERALRSGYQEHISKPVDARELLDAVSRWTQARAVSEEHDRGR